MTRQVCTLMVLLLISLGNWGCEGDAPQKPAAPAVPTPPASKPSADELANIKNFVKPAESAERPALPAGHPPIDSGAAGGMGMMPPPPNPGALNLKYDPPTQWEKQPVRSAMRVDQYRLPRAAGDPEDGELAVFNQSVGGGVEANIDRWRSQFTTADNQPIPDPAFLREALEVNGLKVTIIDVAGRYSGGMVMGADNAPKDNYRMLAAIVETPDGPWFFKATGPSGTMAAHREDFLRFARTMRFVPTAGGSPEGVAPPASPPAGSPAGATTGPAADAGAPAPTGAAPGAPRESTATQPAR